MASDWGLADLSAVIEIIVSELVTNAARACADIYHQPDGVYRLPDGPTGEPDALSPICLVLYSDKSQILIQVWDADHRVPVIRSEDLDSECGRGLLLVQSLSAAWGTITATTAPGKSVWAWVT